MAILVTTEEELEKVAIRVAEKLASSFKSRQNVDEYQKKWIRTPEIKRQYGWSLSSIQNLRNSGLLNYSKVRGTIFYRISDIEKLIEDNIR